MDTVKANPLPSGDQYFKELLKAPVVAWPTIVLFLLSLVVMALSTIGSFQGIIPLWVGAILNGFAMYNLFSVAHDGSHRSLSSNKLINEAVGRIAIMMLLPIAPFEAVRWIHMQHHRFTNDATRDPDNFVHAGAHEGKWWQALVFWPNMDIFYLKFFLKNGGEHIKKNIGPLLAYTVVFIAVLGVLGYMGYGWEVFFLWFVASRIGLFLIVNVFVFLPHYPGDISAQQDVYKASTIRRGMEWLLTPLLVFQNYHLIHHLYPTLPFYRYQKVWHLKYDELVQKNPAVQSTFGLRPVNV